MALLKIDPLCRLLRHPLTKPRTYYYQSQGQTITWVAIHCWCGERYVAQVTRVSPALGMQPTKHADGAWLH